MNRDAHEANRRSWNAVTPAHNSHKRDQAAWLARGGSTLFPEEIALLGDVSGRDLLHLQCNCGQDSLSLARRGARVTGVDIADAAIEAARELSRDSGIAARFERADVLDWLDENRARGDRFDVVFCSYGFIGWLSALEGWARGLHDALRPGGRFVAIEFHPMAFVWDPEWRHVYPYATHGVALAGAGVSDYVGESGEALAPSGFEAGIQGFENPFPVAEFAWGVGDVLGALLGAGLTLERFAEHEHSNGWKGWAEMAALGENRWGVPPGRPAIPLMYSLVARRPG